MSSQFEFQPPQSYSRLCEALSGAGRAPDATPALGELCRVLAASRPGGVFLCLGAGAGELAAWILDGLDLSARLVVVVSDENEAGLLRPLFADDLRVTVHVQNAVDFLDDVRDHRFDLITDLSPGQPGTLARLALARLSLGAMYLSRHQAPALAEMLVAPNSPARTREPAVDMEHFSFAQLRGELGVCMVVHGPHRLAAKRRGGRRARQGVTPLFSSRPPRGR